MVLFVVTCTCVLFDPCLRVSFVRACLLCGYAPKQAGHGPPFPPPSERLRTDANDASMNEEDEQERGAKKGQQEGEGREGKSFSVLGMSMMHGR